jgi:type IV secretory pathway VirB2 component (pilin)
MALTEDEAAKILLVRSVEECDRNVFPTDILNDAVKQAGTDVQGAAWFLRRASYLFEQLPIAYRSILYLPNLPSSWSFPICVLALILGFGTNLLGPANKIHVIRNSVLLLVVWNLFVYLVLIFLSLRKSMIRFDFVHTQKTRGQRLPAGSAGGLSQHPGSQTKIPWILEFFLPGLWKLLHKLRFSYWQTRALADAAGRFWRYWLTVAGPLMVGRWRRVLHYSAASLAIGATVGMYFRGLFHGYEVVFTSTFIRSEETVLALVNVVFGPAFFLSRLLSLDLEGEVDIARLLTAGGDPAEPWLHLFAMMVVTAIVIPRAALGAWQGRKIQKMKSNLPLLFDRYYGEIIESPIRSLIEQEVRKGFGRFAQSTASFVRTDLYDGQIVPKLEGFREKGGRIVELRSEIRNATEAFAPEVKTFVSDRALPEFQRSVSVGVEKVVKEIGTDFIGLKESEELLAEIQVKAPEASADAIGHGYSDAISAAIAVSIAIALGTISGGFGAELEIAILAVLLGTTGPVGFVIGALIGILVAGAGWWFGREKITEFVESIELPAAVVRTTLWESRFQKLVDDGRKQCYESVKARVEAEMEPMVPRITEEVLLGVRRLWEV